LKWGTVFAFCNISSLISISFYFDNILISYYHYIVSNNPCAGVGVARAIRAKFPTANLIALDDHYGSAAGGMWDPVFDSALSMEIMGNAISQSVRLLCKKFETIVDLLTTNSGAYYIPVSSLNFAI
jgi:hypothetical protein